MQHIAEQTNSYYKFLRQKLPPTPHSHFQSWAETTAEELYIFLRLAMLMARVKKLSLAEYCQILNYCGNVGSGSLIKYILSKFTYFL
jgi:hypothetical protein